jgi:phage terminase large subunit GpA-like protein
MTPLKRIRGNALAALRPPPVRPLADWIESTIHLPASATAAPGRMRLWGYQRGICDAVDDPAIERVTVLKSARIGYTALLTAIVGNYVQNAPSSWCNPRRTTHGTMAWKWKPPSKRARTCAA